MAYKFKTPAGQTVDRKLYLVCGNYGTAEAPQWGKLGKRVEDSSAEMDWGEETKKDILGDTYATMKTPIITQTFDPCELDSGDDYQQKVWNLAVVDQDAPALCNQDLLRIHLYAVDEEGNAFAEHRPGRRGWRHPDHAHRYHLWWHARGWHCLCGHRRHHHLHQVHCRSWLK